jgi:ACS family allantoate permease-like MFS transporter
MSAPLEVKHPKKPFAGFNGRQDSVTSDNAAVTVTDLINADEALAFLTSHPCASEIAIEGTAILEDPFQLKGLRKINLTISPVLLSAVLG